MQQQQREVASPIMGLLLQAAAIPLPADQEPPPNVDRRRQPEDESPFFACRLSWVLSAAAWYGLLLLVLRLSSSSNGSWVAGSRSQRARAPPAGTLSDDARDPRRGQQQQRLPHRNLWPAT